MKGQLKLFIIMLLCVVASCSNDENSDQLDISGSWELSKLEDGTDGVQLPPNDGKPVRLNFKLSGSYDGDAGNNEIHGTYRMENGNLILTMSTTEIVNTEWESMFMDAMEDSRNSEEYVLPYTLEGNELILKYDEQSTMTL